MNTAGKRKSRKLASGLEVFCRAALEPEQARSFLRQQRSMCQLGSLTATRQDVPALLHEHIVSSLNV